MQVTKEILGLYELGFQDWLEALSYMRIPTTFWTCEMASIRFYGPDLPIYCAHGNFGELHIDIPLVEFAYIG